MGSKEPIRVLVVDDHRMIRDGIRLCLEASKAGVVVGETGTGTEALELARALKPHVVLLDIRLQGALNGIDTCHRLKKLEPDPPKVVLFSGECRQEHLLGVLECGADGFLLKESVNDSLALVIQQVLQGDFALSSSLARVAFNAWVISLPREQLLSDRDRQIVELLVARKTNDEISAELGMSTSFVGHRLTRIYEVLGAREPKRADAAARWQRYKATGTLE
jgi:DNA-binding NarL/FixJ family response regulator